MNLDENYPAIPYITTRCPRCTHEFCFWFRASDAYEDWSRGYIAKLKKRIAELQAQLPVHDVKPPYLYHLDSPRQ